MHCQTQCVQREMLTKNGFNVNAPLQRIVKNAFSVKR